MYRYLIGYLALVVPMMVYAHKDHDHNHDHHHEHHFHGYHVLHTAELKDLYEQNVEMTVVDARTEKHYIGTRLPNAIRVPHNTSDLIICGLLPAKDALIVTYCTNEECPASKLLMHRLIDMEYTNVYKYIEGIEGWIEAGLPVDIDE